MPAAPANDLGHALVPDGGCSSGSLLRPRRQPAPGQGLPKQPRVPSQQEEHRKDDSGNSPAQRRPGYGALGAAGGRQQNLVVAPPPTTHRRKELAAPASRAHRQRLLMPSVIVDYPVPPEGGHGIEVQAEPAPTGSDQDGPTRRGIKSDPAIARKEHLHPGVGIARPNHISGGQVVELAGPKSVDETRGNSQTPQHDGHGGGEVFAVSLFAFEKEVGQWIMGYRARQLQGVLKVSAKIVFDGPGFVVVVIR